MVSNEEFIKHVNTYGLGETLHYYFDAERLEDEKLRNLWAEAYNKFLEMQLYVESLEGYKEI